MTRTTIDYAALTTLARNVLRSKGFQSSDADDMAQDVIILLWRWDAQNRLNDDATSLCWRIIGQVAADHARCQSRRPTSQLGESIDVAVADASDDAQSDVGTLLAHAGVYRPAVERWSRGDVLSSTDRKRVSRGIAQIREFSGVSDAD